MNDFTFLTEEQCFGKNKLDILKKYGNECAVTDFSILLGYNMGLHNNYTSEGNSLKDRSCVWWTKTPDDEGVCVVDKRGNRNCYDVGYRAFGARPALPYSSISQISSNAVRGRNGILEVEYGEYPQTIVSEKLSSKLETAYVIMKHMNTGMKETGKKYTTNLNSKYIKPRTPFEYEYNGKKYIRLKGREVKKYQTLSDGRTIDSKTAYWIEVEPIKWMIDENADIALSKKAIFSGVLFNFSEEYDGDFEETIIKKFMDEYFAKDIIPSFTNEITLEEDSRKQNPYEFDFDVVSEEDIIKGAILSDVPVFLHGRSGEGKSARVKQLDPDCEIIYMRNATPDSLSGKTVYDSSTGQMIDVPPTWYTKLKEKCENEPDKIHIIFFDELTNALPSIQSTAFNIVLDKEVNGKWQLPNNARIVAAGNELEDSIAANEMAEPLFNRFAHVYIKTTVDDWLKWASEHKIHPAIFAYVSFNAKANMDVLRTPYTGEMPNADPRKWEMASKVLYATNQPEMLRALIGEELTSDFIAFVRTKVITLEDVLKGNYTERDLDMSVSEKYMTAVGLLGVDEEHFEIVRDFMKLLGAEPRAAFESMWAGGDEKRMEKLAEVKMMESLSQGGVQR